METLTTGSTSKPKRKRLSFNRRWGVIQSIKHSIQAAMNVAAAQQIGSRELNRRLIDVTNQHPDFFNLPAIDREKLNGYKDGALDAFNNHHIIFGYSLEGKVYTLQHEGYYDLIRKQEKNHVNGDYLSGLFYRSNLAPFYTAPIRKN